MTLLYPLGLLGLSGVIALIILYIIKPNYQQKIISSTYIWKLSLRYRKKRIPINKPRQILLIICQILFLALRAFALANPAGILKSPVEGTEVVIILDSSASMRAEHDSVMRFDRAIDRASRQINDLLSDGSGIVSVIVANEKPHYLFERISLDKRDDALYALAGMKQNEEAESACSYDTADIEEAIDLCEKVLEVNSAAEIYLYTDTEYDYVPPKIHVVNVSENSEWNNAILYAREKLVENYYTFEIELACYGSNSNINLEVKIEGVNGDKDFTLDLPTRNREPIMVEAYNGVPVTLTLLSANTPFDENAVLGDDTVAYYRLDENIISYRTVTVKITGENDCLKEDDVFCIYGGEREVIKIQYSSFTADDRPTLYANPYINAALDILRGQYSDKRDIRITEVPQVGNIKTSGFDFYIFEHYMPDIMPSDGVVFLIDPDKTPVGADFAVTGWIKSRGAAQDPISFAVEAEHAITDKLDGGELWTRRLIMLTYNASVYKVLWSCDGEPALMIKEEEASKVIVMPFSVHWSNLALSIEQILLVKNIFDYFFPSTLQSNCFSVGETITLRARSSSLNVYASGENDTGVQFTEFPAEFIPKKPDTYSVVQTTDFGKQITENIFVKISAYESNVQNRGEALKNPYVAYENSSIYSDLLFYIAIAFVSLVFIEWLLQIRDM
ncbi:MAG: BatA and WFA domain-containing protein [Clostridia bacterium]|nr:BatA and WFA domain-containing protein [Clostridia bacterium]